MLKYGLEVGKVPRISYSEVAHMREAMELEGDPTNDACEFIY